MNSIAAPLQVGSLHELDPWLPPLTRALTCPASLLPRLQCHSCPGLRAVTAPAQLPAAGDWAVQGLSSTHWMLLGARKSRTSSKLTAENTNRGEKQYKSWDCRGRSANTALQNTGRAVSHLGHPICGQGHGRSSSCGDDTSWYSQHCGTRFGELGWGRHWFYRPIWYFHQWCLPTGCSLWERMQHKDTSILVRALNYFKKPNQNRTITTKQMRETVFKLLENIFKILLKKLNCGNNCWNKIITSEISSVSIYCANICLSSLNFR